MSLDQTTAPRSAEIGFASPALDAARAFREILQAMARPGTPRRLPALTAAAEPLSAAATTTLLTMADGDAPVWIAPGASSPAVDRLLRFYVGAAPVESAERAAFACGRFAALEFQRFPIGTPEYPDRSTTLVVEVDSFDAAAEGAVPLRLSGPGVDGETTLSVSGLGDSFLGWARANHARFPLGLDLLLTCGDEIAGLPRSARVEGV